MSKKNYVPERINLTEEETNSLLTNCEEFAKELNNFLANAVKNLNIANYEDCDSLEENIDLHHTWEQPKNLFLWMQFSSHNLIIAH